MKIAIDLGTAYSVVYVVGRGVVLREPSAVAIHRESRDVIAYGDKARSMLGRTPPHIEVVRPLREGVIANFDGARELLRHYIEVAGEGRWIRRFDVILCVPHGATPVELEALRRESLAAGAHRVDLVKEPFAAALGAGLPIDEPRGNLVVDIGGGTTETALISLGGIVAIQAVRVGSFDIDAAIQSYVRRVYGIAIGERTAEDIKIVLGSAARTEDEVRAEVRGRELMSGLPKTVVLTPEEIREAIDEVVTSMVDSVLACLAQAPPELAQDLLVEGIQLVGGGGMLRGLAARIGREAGVPVHLVDTPLECVVLGAGRCIESFESVRAMFMDARPRAR